VIRATLALALLLAAGAARAAPPAVFVDEKDVVRQEPPPHDGKGMSTAYRISDAAPGRTMEFRKRILHKGAAIGLHVIAHDEVYYVVSGQAEVSSDGVTRRLGPGGAAYLYNGANVGVSQVGDEDLALIIAYPLPEKAK
jgi:mannose-6-phosphate isomerase-like protein (cupin superfamily)